jgi:hypothetical protein
MDLHPRNFAWKDAGWIFLLSRSLVMLTTFIAVSNLPVGKAPPRNCFFQFYSCLTAWKNWDASAFMDIAAYGYSHKLELTAFFPLWPTVMRLLAIPFGGSYEAVYLSGLLLANAFCYLALVVCHYLLTSEFGLSVSRDTLFYLALGPYAIFLFVGYSESLFLLLCLMTFFLLQNNPSGYRWWLAGICGFLASLTRSTGFILLVPYSVSLIEHFWPYRSNLRTHWRSLLNAALPMGLILAGVMAYMLYLDLRFGNPFLFSQKQAEIWDRSFHFPWVGIVSTWNNIITGSGDFDHNILDFIFTMIPIIALIIGWRQLPLRYSLFALAMMLFSLSYPYIPEFPLGSSPRYMQVIFPVFLLFAIWSKQPRLQAVFSAISVTVFTLITVLFVLNISVS